MAKTISLLASRMPVRLDFSAVFFFKYSVHFFYYITHVVSFVQETLEKHFSSCQNVWFCYCTDLCFLHKTTYLWSMRSPGGGEMSLFAYPGVGNRPPSVNKIANPRGCARGRGMVTGRIEPCIKSRLLLEVPHIAESTSAKALRLTMSDENLEVDLSPIYFSFQIKEIIAKQKNITVQAFSFESPSVPVDSTTRSASWEFTAPKTNTGGHEPKAKRQKQGSQQYASKARRSLDLK